MPRTFWKWLPRSNSANDPPEGPPGLPEDRPRHSTPFSSGLVELTGPSSQHIVDVIFVHDLTQDYQETWKMRDLKEQLWPELLPQKVPNARILAFRYDASKATTMSHILSQEELIRHAESLLLEAELLKPGDGKDPRVIFVGHGYGGLICEQILKLTNDKMDDQNSINRTSGLILFGTPHFRAGIAQWAILSAKRRKIECAETTQLQDWSQFENDISSIVKMQRDFRSKFTKPCRDNQIRIACCFAELPDPKNNLILSPEWAILPRVRPIAIHADHFGMTKFKSSSDSNFKVIAGLLSKWVRELADVHFPPAHHQQDKNSALEEIMSKSKDEDSVIRSRLPPEAIDCLIALSKDEYPSIRSRAAEALGKQSNLGPEAIDRLITLSEDVDRQVRSIAGEALGKQSNLGPEAIDRLITLSKDEYPSIRSRAAEALGKQSNLGPEAIDRLITLSEDVDRQVRSSAAEGITRVQPVTVRTMSTPRSIFNLQIDFPKLKAQPCETTLGRLVEDIYGANEVETSMSDADITPQLPDGNTSVIRALTNWYRLQFLFGMGLADIFISWDQRYSYQLLFDWWMAMFENPSTPLSYLGRFLRKSQILKDEMANEDPRAHQELWECIQRHMAALESTENPIPEDYRSDDKRSNYSEALWQLFVYEFHNPETYVTVNVSPNEIITSIRRDAAMKAYCRQAAMQCREPPNRLFPRLDCVESTRPSSLICSIKASDPKFPRMLSRGPLLRACPWLEHADAQKSPKPPEENDDLGGWPRYLWDIKRRRKVCTQDFGKERPPYTTISHTWGRWARYDRPGYRIPGGLEYRVPYNERFNVEKIPDCLVSLGEKIAADYVWLDLVCIPQGIDEKDRDGEGDKRDTLREEDKRVKLGEISRQGSIFRNATTSIAWFHDVGDFSCLKGLFQWFSLSTLPRGPETERLKEQALQYISGRPTGLLGDFVEKDEEDKKERPSIIVTGGDEAQKVRPGNSWFTSLWTLQETCLRPDMWLATCRTDESPEAYKWNIFSLEEGLSIPLNGFLCLYNEYKNYGSRDEGNDSPQIESAMSEISDWSHSTGLHELLELSQIDILRLGDRRHCKERRAEAIMSAIGANNWFEEVENGLYDPETDRILEKYPRKFIEEIRKHIPGEFFATYIKVPYSDPKDVNMIQAGGFDSEDGKSLVVFYTMGWLSGSLLPFSKLGHHYFRFSQAAPFRIRYKAHESVESWGIACSGGVEIKEACVISSNTLKIFPMSQEILMCKLWGFIPGIPPGVDREEQSEDLRKLFETVDLHEWIRSRHFEAHAVMVMDREETSNMNDERKLHTVMGVILRGTNDKAMSAGPSRLVKIGNFWVISSESICLPDKKYVDWTVL